MCGLLRVLRGYGTCVMHATCLFAMKYYEVVESNVVWGLLIMF